MPDVRLVGQALLTDDAKDDDGVVHVVPRDWKVGREKEEDCGKDGKSDTNLTSVNRRRCIVQCWQQGRIYRA